MDAPRRLKTVSVAVFLGYLAFCVGVLFFLEIRHFSMTPAGLNADVKSFTVRKGETFKTVAGRLYREAFVRSALKLRLYARLTGDARRIRAGEYALSAAKTPAALLEVLTSGRVIQHRVTIPEGYSLSQIAGLLEDAGLADRKAFIKAATDPLTTAALGIEAPSLEGYLFPETYSFPRPVSPEKILSVMVEAFQKAIPSRWQEDAAKAGLSLHQVVTLASMIEKETGAAFERPVISSVFHNRLKKKMRLESDPTVIYGIENFDGNLTREHLSRPTPYNTYRIFGLPPGPIANPGAGALEAAVYPAKTRFLYFVSKNDGTHHFSEDVREHLSAVRRHQLKRKKAP